MDRRAAWVLGIIFGGLFLLLFAFLAVFWAAVRGGSRAETGGDRIGVIEIKGEITDAKKTLEDLKDFRDDKAIKAVVVRIDSPGGAVAPSQEIYEALRKLREKKKVVASMGSLAASGGYYVACAAEKIYADPGTLTGSIGVIMQVPNVTGLMQWAGVHMNTLAAGKMKDSLSPFRDMRPDERTYYEGVLEDVHDQFIGAVALGRGLKVEQVRPLADGRVFTGRKAKELKLVDELGGMTDAVQAAAKMAGLTGEPKLEYPEKPRKLLNRLLGDDAETLFHGLAQTATHTFGFGLEYKLPAAP
jgi:protease-4